jgi:TM2 domain-containing membrane protein YozV
LNTPPSSLSGPGIPGTRTLGPIEKYCGSCGAIINIKANPCPNCGARQHPAINKTSLVLITFFLGGMGAHKFFVGKTIQGIFYLVFCWTLIPSIIAFVEFLIYAFTDETKLQEKFPHFKSEPVIIAVVVFFCMTFVLAILAAIAIPLYLGYMADANLTVMNKTGSAVASFCAACESRGGTISSSFDTTGRGSVRCSSASSGNDSLAIPNGAIVTITPSSDSGGTVTVRSKSRMMETKVVTYTY